MEGGEIWKFFFESILSLVPQDDLSHDLLDLGFIKDISYIFIC